MKHFIGTKQILAKPMDLISYREYMDLPKPPEANNVEGYLVEYLDSFDSNHKDHDNYISWSPKDVFERSYKSTEDMTFGDAIVMLKEGKKVARKGWNGKGMYLWLLPKSTIKKDWVKDEMLLDVFGDRDELDCLGSIRMKTASGEVLTGWLASQTDMLAEDWIVVS